MVGTLQNKHVKILLLKFDNSFKYSQYVIIIIIIIVELVVAVAHRPISSNNRAELQRWNPSRGMLANHARIYCLAQ